MFLQISYDNILSLCISEVTVSLFYWEGIQEVIDSFREEVRDRINFELTCIISACPCSFDRFLIPLVNGDDISDPVITSELTKVIGAKASQLTILSQDDDIDVVVYIAEFNKNIYVLNVFTTDIGRVSVSEVTVAKKRYEDIELMLSSDNKDEEI